MSDRVVKAIRRILGLEDAHREYAFLPAALEIVEAPPSPTGRVTMFAICGMFALALIWSITGRVDIVATAHGKIIPSGRVKLVQPMEIGTVSRILVADGQRVSRGDVLIELDGTETGVDLERFSREVTSARLDVLRLEAELSAYEAPDMGSHVDFHPDVAASSEDIAGSAALLTSNLSETREKIASIDGQIAQRKSEASAAGLEIERLKSLLPIIRRRAAIYRHVSEAGYGSKLQAAQSEQELTDASHQLPIAEEKRREVLASIVSLEASRREALETARGKARELLEEARRREERGRDELTKAKSRNGRTSLVAPDDGTVQQLSIHTIGGVVTPGQVLMTIVPLGASLEVEAAVANTDAGFVREGQEVAIKIDSYPFTRYGLRHGRIVGVSRDSVDGPNGVAGHSSADASNRGEDISMSSYTARISLDRNAMKIDGLDMPLLPGMRVSAEILTGRRRLIDYLLSPVERHASEGFTER